MTAKGDTERSISGPAMNFDFSPEQKAFGEQLRRSLHAGSAMAGTRLGSDDILRCIVAERGFGLPDDVRPDKGIALNQQTS